MLVSTILAFGTTVPLGSSTVPVISPRSSWAESYEGIDRKISKPKTENREPRSRIIMAGITSSKFRDEEMPQHHKEADREEIINFP